MDASHPSRPLSRMMTALCAAVVLFAGAITVAGAQTLPPAQSTATANAALDQVVAQASPSPAPPAGGTATPRTPNNPPPPNTGGSTQTPVRPLPPVSHLPIIDFVVTFTQPAYYGNHPNAAVAVPNPVAVYDPIDLGGTVRIPVTRKLNLLFDRIVEGTVNQPLECVIVAGGPPNSRTCPNDSRDVLLQYHATYAFDRFVSMDIGDSFRHRVWNSNASGVSAVPFPYSVSSTEHHFGYLGVSYTTKPWKEILHSTFVFSETLDSQNVDHHVGVCSGATVNGQCTGHTNYIDENPHQSVYYETTQGVSMIVPVDPRHGTSLLLNERWGALNFYENPTLFGGVGVPYRWNSALTYQLNKRFSPGFTLALRHSDYHAIPGAALPFPNAIHVGSWDVIGTFHVDTNTFFH